MRVSAAGSGIWIETTLMRLGRELSDAGREASEGTRLDPGRTLGHAVIDVARVADELVTLRAIEAGNGLLGTRLASMQEALGGVTDIAARMFGEVAATPADGDGGRLAATAASALDDLGRRLNVTQNGAYLFSASAARSPAFLGSGDAAAPPLRALVDQFSAHFGFPPTDPAAATVTGAQMTAFLNGPARSVLAGPAWSVAWTGADGPASEARVAPGEVVAIDIDARAEGVQQLTSGLAALAALAGGSLSGEARAVLVADARERIGAGVAGIDSMRADLGRIQGAVADANERLGVSRKALEWTQTALLAVDPAQAAQRLNEAVQRLEASYAVTRRLSELSLLKVL